MSDYQPTAKQEQAIREFLHEAVVPLIEDVLVKKLGQAMAFLREQQQEQQPEQEPVGWLNANEGVDAYAFTWRKKETHDIPLYTAPPKREWVGLTGNEARKFYEKYTDREELIYAIDKFLEEKNGG